MAADPAISVRPSDEATWDDLRAVFGTRGAGAGCWCQRYKLAPKEAFRSYPPDVRASRLRRQSGCEGPGGPSGLVAYVDGEPAGWCSVEPRPAYGGLLRVFRVPWDGRDEDKEDADVWAVTCFLVRKGYRRRGVGTALAAAAVDHAREHGAGALEGYPITRPDVMVEELHVGTVGMFAAAGLAEVHRPSKRRAVMRIDFRSGR